MTSEQKTLTTNKLEYFIPAAFSLSLIISCIIISSKKYFWNDEFLSFYLVNDSSFTDMMQALGDTINSSPPLYFVLAWFWSKLFTASELSLRLFSSLGICIAQTVVWITLRRTYNFWATSLGTIAIFCVASAILQQNAEARFYGLFMAVCALGLFQFDLLCRRERNSQGLLVLNTLIHIAIIQTHIYGFFYSGTILLALIIRDIYFKNFSPKVYLSILLAWVSFIPWIPAFLHQAKLGKPHSWIQVPGFNTLINYCYYFIPWLFILGMILIGQSRDRKLGENDNNEIKNLEKFNQITNQNLILETEVSFLILGFLWLTIPLLSWLISRTLQPILVPRYILPNKMILSILLASFLSHFIDKNSLLNQRFKVKKYHLFSQRTKLIFLIILSSIIFLNPLVQATKYSPQTLPGLNDNRYGYNDLPIVVEYSHPFLQRFHYSSQRNRYFFILDWQVALDKTSGLSSPGEYKTMDALNRNYPDIFTNHIVQTQNFLSRYNHFLVLNIGNKCTSQDSMCMRWYEIIIQNNPHYITQKLGIIEGMDLILVEKNSSKHDHH